MKAIQFKKIGTFVGNHEDVQELFGGVITYSGKGRGAGIQMTYECGIQNQVLQFDDWIVDLNGVILVLDDIQYQALLLETLIAKKQINNQKKLGQIIHNSIKAVIQRDQRRGLLADNKFAEGGYTKPPYITEMENQINALSTMVSALDCRLNVLSGGK